MRHTTITLKASALQKNLNTIRQNAPTAKVMAMVKANAYGHGIAWALQGLLEADAYGVASFGEGVQVFDILSKINCQKLSVKPIVLIEGVFSQSEWLQALDYNFSCVVHCQNQLDWALANVPKNVSFSRTIWLKYNTGMNRLGFGKNDVLASAKLLMDKGYNIILTSHFACADDRENLANGLQIERFNEVLGALKAMHADKIQGSLCNSAGIFNFPSVHYDWVRAGIALYGGMAVADKTPNQLGLRPVMTFTTHIFAIHELNVGEQVGYGGLWMADKPSRIGVLSVGYGDGYPRVVQNAHVFITKNSQQFLIPVVGRVAMDMMMIDITDVPVGVGDEVVLWGEGLPAYQVANWANTIDYELFCKTTARPLRQLAM
ncbi:alanine racemase [Moraxella oblonga]|uniref:alanine racemase n=1 Tax=Moraxella oblonga TaxID=200413 RepID=UPI000829F59B|nr:alanine racemase [Moraxella oblonga]